jgi:hypothetical protein
MNNRRGVCHAPGSSNHAGCTAVHRRALTGAYGMSLAKASTMPLMMK